MLVCLLYTSLYFITKFLTYLDFGAKEFVILDSSNKLSFYKWHKVFSNVSLSSENMSDYAYEEGGDFLLENVWYFDDEVNIYFALLLNYIKTNLIN